MCRLWYSMGFYGIGGLWYHTSILIKLTYYSGPLNTPVHLSAMLRLSRVLNGSNTQHAIACEVRRFEVTAPPRRLIPLALARLQCQSNVAGVLGGTAI